MFIAFRGGPMNMNINNMKNCLLLPMAPWNGGHGEKGKREPGLIISPTPTDQHVKALLGFTYPKLKNQSDSLPFRP